MKQLSDCRVLLMDDATPNLDIMVEGLKSDHKFSLSLAACVWTQASEESEK